MESPIVSGTGARVPFGRPTLWGREREYVNEALDASQLSQGPFVERFEFAVTRFLRSAHGLCVSNGTAALMLAFLGLELVPGDEVVVPSFGFMAAANVALLLGLVVRFADVDRRTWCVTKDSVSAACTPQTRCVVVTHTYGNMADVLGIKDWGERRGIKIIEDAAEAFGSTQRGVQAGTIGHVGTYSFHAAKAVTTGEGGFVTTDDIEVHDRMRLVRSHGVRHKRYWHEVPGINARMSNVQAAIGLGQMEQIEKVNDARQRVERMYRSRLASVGGIELQAITPETVAILWGIAVRLTDDHDVERRDQIIEELENAGVESRAGFPSSSHLGIYEAHSCPTSDDVARSVIVLPSPPSLTESEIDKVVSDLHRILTRP